MGSVRYLLTRLLFVVMIVFIGGLLHQFFIYPEIKANEGWLQALAEKKIKLDPEVLYFSESPNKAIGHDDSDRRFISEMIQDSIKLHLESIDTGAIHAGVFYEILNRIPNNKLPKILVVNLTIRSHGVNWIHSNLENSLQRNFVYWNNRPGIVNHFLASVKWYNYLSPAEHLRAIEYGDKFLELPFGGSHKTIKKWCDSLFISNQNPDEGLTFIKHFGFLIDENNVQLKRFDQIASWAKYHKIPLVFIILPENVSKMELSAGKDLSNLVQQNAKFLFKHFSKKGVHVLNLYNRLSDHVFFEKFPTEHYTEEGRALIASEVARIIKKIDHKN